MLNYIFNKIFSIGAIATLIGCSSQAPPASIPPTRQFIPTTAKAIVLADVSNNPAKKIERYQPMADYLAANLQEFGIDVGEVKVASNPETISQWLESGEVDLYFDSPYPATIVTEKSGAQPILRRWKGEKAEYYGIIFTMSDRGINSLTDLKGHTLAFDEPYSTSGYILSLAVLLDAGLDPVEKTSTGEGVAPDRVGYVFSDDDENTIQWAIDGKVDAGAIDIGSYLKIPEQTRAEIIVLAETKKVARHLVMVRPGMDPQLQRAIASLLLNMNDTPEGKAVLEQFEDTEKFDELPPESSIAQMRKFYERVKNR